MGLAAAPHGGLKLEQGHLLAMLIRRWRRFTQMMNKAFVFETRRAEVQEKRTSQPRGPEIVNYLGILYGGDGLERLQFHDHGIEAEKIGAVGRAQGFAFVRNGNGMLPQEWYATFSEFNLQRLLVNGLQEAVSKFPMHLHARAKDRIGLLIPSFCICVHRRHLRFHAELVQERGLFRQQCLYLRPLPQGQGSLRPFVKWLMEHQKEAGVFATVSTLVNQLCDNPAAKLTAQEIVKRLQRAQQARPVATTAPNAPTPTPAPGCPSGNCVATLPAG
jgi:hypothetical protein